MKSAFTFTTLAAIFVCLTGCDNKPASVPNPGSGVASPAPEYPGTEAGAKALLAAFLKGSADTKALTGALRPAPADYTTVFVPEFAGKLAALHAPMWASGAAIGPKEGQTEILLNGVPSAEIKVWSKNASDNLPGGYEKIKDSFNEGFTVYAFKFVKSGETLGMAFDGLVHVNGHWRLFPKPFRAAQ